MDLSIFRGVEPDNAELDTVTPQNKMHPKIFINEELYSKIVSRNVESDQKPEL